MTSWLATDYFSPGFKNLVNSIRSRGGQQEVLFPPGCRETRCKEPLRDWFRRIVMDQLNDQVGPCQVEENMAVFARLKYDKELITFASIQVLLVTGGNLEDYYLEEPESVGSYLRFDYDPTCLGPLFKEPHPHVHCVPAGEPRFGLPLHGNAVVDFFDFVYRNYRHEEWTRWARNAYEAPPGGGDSDFQVIEEAFKASQHQALASTYAESLGRIKTACRDRKDRIFSGRIDVRTAATIAYDGDPSER